MDPFFEVVPYVQFDIRRSLRNTVLPPSFFVSSILVILYYYVEM